MLMSRILFVIVSLESFELPWRGIVCCKGCGGRCAREWCVNKGGTGGLPDVH